MVLRVAIKANRLREPNSGAKESPGVQEAAAVGEVGTYHDEGLDAEKGRPVHERRHAKSLHCRSN